MIRPSSRWPRALALATAFGAAFGATTAGAACAHVASSGPTSVRAEPAAPEPGNRACRIEATALQAATWRDALVIDVRRRGELDEIQVPRALRLRRAELDSTLAAVAGRALLLLGSGLDDASLVAVCQRLSAVHDAPVAVVDGGLPGWLRGGRPILLPGSGDVATLSGSGARHALAPRLRLTARELAVQLRNPGARVLQLDPARPLGDALPARVSTADSATLAAGDLATAVGSWLDGVAAERSGPAIVLAPANADGLDTLTRIAATHAQPFWSYVPAADEDLAALAEPVHRAGPDPLRREACAWN